MTSLLAVIVVLAGTLAASLVVERVLGRSRKEMVKPGWYYVFFAAFIPLLLLVFNTVSGDSSLLYAAYALSGSAAALAAQCFYGVKVPHRR
jgi:cbb3-type cytochrome oxidase subunit 1